jgi:hypothetical protein
MVFSTSLTLFLSACVATAAEIETVNLPLVTSPPPSYSGVIARNFQSFSIELSSWADYAGEKSS